MTAFIKKSSTDTESIDTLFEQMHPLLTPLWFPPVAPPSGVCVTGSSLKGILFTCSHWKSNTSSVEHCPLWLVTNKNIDDHIIYAPPAPSPPDPPFRPDCAYWIPQRIQEYSQIVSASERIECINSLMQEKECEIMKGTKGGREGRGSRRGESVRRLVVMIVCWDVPPSRIFSNEFELHLKVSAKFSSIDYSMHIQQQ